MAKAKKDKPSFGGSGERRGDAGWVYRSDAAAKAAPDAASKAAPDAAAKVAPNAGAKAPGAVPKSASGAGAGAGERARKTSAAGATRTAGTASRTESTPAAAPSGDRMAAAHALVDRYVKYASAAGLVPIPVVDVVTIAAVQVTMLGALAEHYEVPYSRERGKTLIATILGGLMPSLAGHQMLKVFGPIAGMASVAGFAAAATYGVGHVFIAHFESGGTLLDLDIDAARRSLADAIARR